MTIRCELSDLPVSQCACKDHAPIRDSWRTGEYSIVARHPSHFNSECDGCGNPIDQGDPIARTDNGDYICERCSS
jgi:hypothetical protein